jgi:hypothetical protein
MGAAIRRGTFNIVRQVAVDDETLKKIAEALGIPEAEHGRITSISGEITIAPPVRPPGAATPPTPPGTTTPSGTATPPTPPGGGGGLPPGGSGSGERE